MRRVASHYVYWNGLFRMHYVELDDAGCLTGIYPLEGEIAGTEFYDGILFPVVEGGRIFHADGTKIPCRWNPVPMPIGNGGFRKRPRSVKPPSCCYCAAFP